MSKGMRRVLMVMTLLLMVGVTTWLGIFLLCKVAAIEITGDTVYEQGDILKVCGYKPGDNLVFLSTESEEEALKQQLPYIESVEIRKHLPNRLEIHIVGATAVANVASGDTWLLVSSSGKILKQGKAQEEGIMQVTGLNPVDPAPGKTLVVEDEKVQKAFQAIVAKLGELDMAEKFTKLDLSDLYHITMMYEDRILFDLGNGVDLDYKVTSGCKLVQEKIGAGEKGTLDLSYAGDVKRAYFTPEGMEPVKKDKEPSSDTSQDPSSDSSGGESGGEDSTVSQEEDDGIPNEIFTGEEEGNNEGDEDGNDNENDNGNEE